MNINDKTIRATACTIRIIIESVVLMEFSSYSPPNHITAIRIGLRYFTCHIHHFPSIILLLLLFRKSTNLSALNTQAKSTHSTNTESIMTMLFTNMSVTPSMYPPADVAYTIEASPPIMHNIAVALDLVNPNLF